MPLFDHKHRGQCANLGCEPCKQVEAAIKTIFKYADITSLKVKGREAQRRWIDLTWCLSDLFMPGDEK
jgi:hypothetical protein